MICRKSNISNTSRSLGIEKIMNKKVKNLANELSVSKQTIQYHYNKLTISNQQRDSHGYIIITDSAEKIIRSKVTNKERQTTAKR